MASKARTGIQASRRFSEDFKCSVPLEAPNDYADIVMRAAGLAKLRVYLVSTGWLSEPDWSAPRGAIVRLVLDHGHEQFIIEIPYAKYMDPAPALAALNERLGPNSERRLFLIVRGGAQYVVFATEDEIAQTGAIRRL
jgi:hypothetical protein